MRTPRRLQREQSGARLKNLVDENQDAYNELELAKTRIVELENELNKANKIIDVLTEKLEQNK